ncbi:protein kinase C delta type-like [Stylophora pistillata]|uniref:protein kinase C delta type-like n=1 Tax=Stylophora pistillata TaxID=50429 RepID=UPI000C044DA7|nr:protein kinase C delta type-like [Stylophora pistillata]
MTCPLSFVPWEEDTLLWQTCYQLPFYDDQERNMFENIVYTTPDIPDWLGTEARDCLLKLLRKCPAVRLGVYNYHLHPFFSGKEPLAITCGSSAPNATAENEINPMSGFFFLVRRRKCLPGDIQLQLNKIYFGSI